MVKRFCATISYDGGDYAGWQVQPNDLTVQGRIEGAVREITGESRKVHGSGRTDQGVHARQQVAHFDLRKDIAARSLQRGLNAVLPPDIRILRIKQVNADFHARRTARGKEYRYFIWNAEIMPPLYRRYRTHVRAHLDVDAMRIAAGLLQGRHDFAAFTANPKTTVESTVRELTRLTITKKGSEIVIRAEANGFLYKMVRSLAGFLIRVGEGVVLPREAKSILLSRRRTSRVPTAPARGLFLWKVWY